MPGKVERCRICGGTDFKRIIDLGFMPPADNFLKPEQLSRPETYYPLRLIICQNCQLVQLDYVVPPEKLFHADYPYDMGVTDSGAQHFHTMAQELGNNYPDKKKVIDIGSNTGELLRGFQQQGKEVLGIEPCSNICDKARAKGIPTKNRFFSQETARDIAQDWGRSQLITATNVVAHIDDLHDLLRGVKQLLTDEGVFIFEVPYLINLLENNEFDTIYHEHLSYFGIKPLKRLFKEHAMVIKDIEEQKIHGGSLRIHVGNKQAHQESDRVDKFIEKEEQYYQDHYLTQFRDRVNRNKRQLRQLLRDLKEKGNKLAAVGAPAKGSTLLNYCNLGQDLLDFATEKSPLKLGKLTPGTHLPIKKDQALLEEDVDYALLLPWNFARQIIDNLEQYKKQGGQFILPVPRPRIVDGEIN